MDQQQQEFHPNPGSSLFQMNLDAQNSYNLRSAASWGKVLGGVGTILGIIFLIIAIQAMSRLGSYDSYRYRRGGFDEMFGSNLAATRLGLWIIVLTAVIFIMGGVFSFTFGNKINAALKSNDQDGLNKGFAALRNYYAVRSITLIILLLLFLIGFAGSL